MGNSDVWGHRPWVSVAESVLGHVAATIAGFIITVIGLMLPIGIVMGLFGVALVVGGLLARTDRRDRVRRRRQRSPVIRTWPRTT